jgi:hypothetical protein
VLQPTNAFAGQIGVQTGNGVAGAGAAAVLGGFSGLIICSANIPDKVAIAMDTQMDDGRSDAGTVRAWAQGAPNQTAPVAAAGAYAETGVGTYGICRSL